MRFRVTVRKLNVTDGQTDGRADRRMDRGIAISPIPGPTARREIIKTFFGQVNLLERTDRM